MKITTQTFDIFELAMSLLHQLYQFVFDDKKKEKLSQQQLIDYDFVVGQIAKIALFLMQIIYYLDLNKLDPISTSLLIQGYYVFAVFIVLVESKYIYGGYSYTFHRIVAYRIMNIVVNLISLWRIHQDKSLLYNWENIIDFYFGIAELLLIGLVFFTAVEIVQLSFQLCTKLFSCMKKFDNTKEYDSPGGCGYVCVGQGSGITLMGGIILLIFYWKTIPFSTLFTLKVIVLESLVGLEFILSCVFYCKSGKVQKDPPRSKKVICFGYGFCIGALGVFSGPAILVVVIIYAFIRTLCFWHQFDWRCIICCWCATIEKGHKYKQTNISINTNNG
ncbi:unnamed protein product (macronuclear) [Paramecium tetraurelia]|uniref:Transmembrane protein n=1 Tax=Paramecium tetraurelia TaxID=5888 RepID=A0E2B9_PARTE|nr:uncharacterized protein GSPATT00022608001 [Paramecium tetraurelia]CAK89436.1 unnamed protein product [Paramecium tetraurelia]|eukprot:XP_001456833.1 hypothetical protein (macronuclear) [Paramecium tetraurelia strain d4-2]